MTDRKSINLVNSLHLFQKAYNDQSFGIDWLAAYVLSNRSVTNELSSYRLQFDIQQVIGKIESDRTYDGLYFQYKSFDARYNFCLTYDHDLIASVGFSAEDGFGMIRQIQGIQGKGDLLKDFAWEKAMVAYASAWMQARDIPEVRIMSVYNNKQALVTFDSLKKKGIYGQEVSFEQAVGLSSSKEYQIRLRGMQAKANIHLMPHRGFLTYDQVAIECGFVQLDDRNYSLKFR
ncbi:MAG: hypothetical protein NDI94_01670 [Candidatus Woesearchaeota archaeon]|nr:hypothetical protein [Candidatus Woesearchaeota archaeon]